MVREHGGLVASRAAFISYASGDLGGPGQGTRLSAGGRPFLVSSWPSSNLHGQREDHSQSLYSKTMHPFSSTLRTRLPANSLTWVMRLHHMNWNYGAGRYSVLTAATHLFFYGSCLLFLCGGFSTDYGLIVILSVWSLVWVRKSLNSRRCQRVTVLCCCLHVEQITWAHCLLYRTGDKCVLNFKPCVFGKELHKAEGCIHIKGKVPF